MNAIIIRRKLDSDTLHIPELNSMIGREVEIIVRQAPATSLDDFDPQAFWKGKTLDELAAEQGVGPFSFSENLGHFSEASPARTTSMLIRPLLNAARKVGAPGCWAAAARTMNSLVDPRSRMSSEVGVPGPRSIPPWRMSIGPPAA